MKNIRVGIAVYKVLVNRIPGIQSRYKQCRSRVHGLGRAGAWLYLLWLNISYYVLRNKALKTVDKYPYYEEKRLLADTSESQRSVRETPEEFAQKLLSYDVISFDVFDTLIFRPFSEPADLFYFVAEKLNYLDFRRIRCEMEYRSRGELYKRTGSREVNLQEIYELLERETGIGADEGMAAELEAEYRFCFANPYMHKVAGALKKHGKRVVVTSDMYLNKEQIGRLLRKAGYGSFDAYYISSDCRTSKSSGGLYEIVREREGREKRLAHVGDHPVSDVKQAKKHGIDAFHYPNVNTSGMPYRAEDMSAITGSLYRGLVNTHIHNGLRAYSQAYEYGFIYGGLFAAGYCRFIHKYVEENHVEKLLFLARDGELLKQVYDRMYPEENTEYVYWSRLAAAKLSAGRYKYDYFRRFLYHKVNQGYRLSDIFRTMEIEDMLDRMCGEEGLKEGTALTDKNVETVKGYLTENWTEVLSHYEGQVKAAAEYYGQVMAGIKRAAAVDIGWAGSGAVTLDYMMNAVWKMDCEVTGIIAGTNSCNNYEMDAGEPQLTSGKLVSYLFSQQQNRDIWKLHDAAKNHNLYWELFLDSQYGSLKGFYPDKKGGYRIVLKEPQKNADMVMQIRKGILDFTDRYLAAAGTEGVRISGRDAYAPMVLVAGRNNGAYRKGLDRKTGDANLC